MTTTIRLTICATLFAAGLLAQAAPGFTEREPRYRLELSDVVEVGYRYTPEYNQTVTLQPDGFVSLELAGDLMLEGLTVDEAREAIVKKSAARLRDPEVSLLLKDFQKPFFVVAGNVGEPGRFEIRGRVTAVEAIGIAGGFTDKSKHSQVILYRRVSLESAQARVLNMKEIMSASGLNEDIELRSGDLLVIPQNTVSKIERFVKWASIGVSYNPAAAIR